MQIQCDICFVKLSCFVLHSSSRSDLFLTHVILMFIYMGNGTDIYIVAYCVRVYIPIVSVNDSLYCFSISGPVTKWTLLTSEPQSIRVKRSGRSTHKKKEVDALSYGLLSCPLLLKLNGKERLLCLSSPNLRDGWIVNTVCAARRID